MLKNFRKNIIFYKNILYNDNIIKYKNLRLIDDIGNQLGLFNINEAIDISKNKNMDLIIVNSNIIPPICKIVNYEKHIYNINKLIKKNKKKQRITQIKEIQINKNIDINDFCIKINKIKEFLIKKNKVKIILKFKGREIYYTDLGLKVLNRIKNDLNFISTVEFISNKMENKQVIMILSPINKKSI